MKLRREYIENEPGRTVVVRHLVTDRFDYNWHHHPEFELTLIVRGRGTRLVGDCFDEFAAGDLVLLGQNLPHTWMSEPSAAGSVEAYYVHFNREDLGGWHESAELEPLLSRSQRGLAFSTDLEEPRTMLQRAANGPGHLRHMIHFLNALAALADAPSAGTPITSMAYEMSSRSTRPSSPTTESRLEVVHSIITNSYPHHLDFTMVAQRAGMSEAGFSRFFRHATGRTFTTYVQEVRVAESCRLLAETELSMSFIAHNSGFGSLTQFNRVFRRLKGCTPSQWRRRTAPT